MLNAPWGAWAFFVSNAGWVVFRIRDGDEAYGPCVNFGCRKLDPLTRNV